MGNKKGTRSLNLVFTKDKHGTICLVGIYGQYWNASDEAKIHRGWGYSTSLVEFQNNTRFELPLTKLKWYD